MVVAVRVVVTVRGGLMLVVTVLILSAERNGLKKVCAKGVGVLLCYTDLVVVRGGGVDVTVLVVVVVRVTPA